MEISMKVIIKKINIMERENLQEMIENILVNGKMENLME